jgi:glutathione synthase/RimK-type ligase-like ATP-grasp enzyme
MKKIPKKDKEGEITLGYIFYGLKFGDDEKTFIKLAKKKNINLVMFNIYKRFDNKKTKKKAKNCVLIFSNSGEEKAIKFVKYLEKIGSRVIESSRSFYRDENKWGLYLKCKKNKIPTPRTILLKKDMGSALAGLKKFNEWPVILKRIYGCQGDFVSKANNLKEAEIIINKFNKKAKISWPIIAQRFIPSPSYRVTTIDGRIVQTAIKQKGSWKKTGVYTKTFKKFKISPKLKTIITKVTNASEINVCGIDLLKKNGRWYVLELNGQPCFGFFEEERAKLIDQVLNFLKKKATARIHVS